MAERKEKKRKKSCRENEEGKKKKNIRGKARKTLILNFPTTSFITVLPYNKYSVLGENEYVAYNKAKDPLMATTNKI